MSKIVRYEFMGSWFYFWLGCLSVVFLPVSILYLINGTIQIESEMSDPEAFVEAYRAGKLKTR